MKIFNFSILQVVFLLYPLSALFVLDRVGYMFPFPVVILVQISILACLIWQGVRAVKLTKKFLPKIKRKGKEG